MKRYDFHIFLFLNNIEAYYHTRSQLVGKGPIGLLGFEDMRLHSGIKTTVSIHLIKCVGYQRRGGPPVCDLRSQLMATHHKILAYVY